MGRRGLLAAAAVSPLLGQAAGATVPLSPRLFFTPTALATATALRTSGHLGMAWTNLLSAADAALRAGTSAFNNTTDATHSWQRRVGWSMANLAAAYLLGGNAAYRDMAVALATAAAGYPVWGLASLNGGDLAAAELLFGTAMVVDWLGGEMAASTLATLVASLRQRGAQMASYASGVGGPAAYWSQWWVMNHLWDNVGSLFAAGLALQPHASADAASFLGVAMPLLRRAFVALPPDGATQESPTYWEFTAEAVLKFQYLTATVLGETLSGPWLRHAAGYRAAMALPLADCTTAQSVVDQADGAAYPWFGPEYQLRRLAALNRDGVAQALAARLEAAALTYPASPWLNFVWFDPTVPTGTPAPALLQHFTDQQIVVSRSDRSGHEAMAIMRAGPPLGQQAQAQAYDHNVGLSHVHQDVNHVTLFALGHYLLRDDGYASRKLTAQHNTLLVNGIGQNFEGGPWSVSPSYPLPNLQPSLTVIKAGSILDYWVGQAAAAYPAAAGLHRFDRHVLFIKPDVLVVVDDLAAAQASAFSLLWHPAGRVVPTSGPRQFLVKYPTTTARHTFVLPDGGDCALTSRAFQVDAGPLTSPEFAITIKATAAQAGAVVAWGANGGGQQVTLRRQGQSWLVVTPTLHISLVPSQRTVTVT